MAMDREEQIGLGAAVGGHALLFIGMALGLFMAADRIVEPKPMAVTIVGEDAVSTAPDPVQEEPAASAPAAASEMDSESAEPEALPVSEPESQPVAKPVVRETPKPVAKPVTKPVAKPVTKSVTKPVPAPVRKATSPATQPRTAQKPAAKAARGQAGLGDIVNAVGKEAQKKAGTGTSSGTPATMTSTQVAAAVSVSLRGEIEPLFKRCAPSGVDVSELVTLLTLKIGKDKGLTDVVFNSQSGVNASNRPQAPLHKDCAIRAARAASPFKSLPDEGYAQWASWPMKFKTR
jgi:periplasmic protein TonB